MTTTCAPARRALPTRGEALVLDVAALVSSAIERRMQRRASARERDAVQRELDARHRERGATHAVGLLPR
jgi:hypothetical protein